MADKYGVSHLCEFVTDDVNKAVSNEHGYDFVLWGSAGDVLGDNRRTLEFLKDTLKELGYVIISDAYLNKTATEPLYKHYYPSYDEWLGLFSELNLTLISYNDEPSDIYEDELNNIIKRAGELKEKFPEKAELFESYVRSQRAEYTDLDLNITGIIWLLRKD